jgi:3'-5' exoribonuclease
MPLNELTDGAEVDQCLLVKEVERRARRDGGEYLRLLLGDRTGAVPCMVWEAYEEIAEFARPGVVVTVTGRYVVHPRFGPQINLRELGVATPGTYAAEELADGPPRSVTQMEGEIR